MEQIVHHPLKPQRVDAATNNNNSVTCVTVGAKRTLEYVFEALSRLNVGASKVKLRGVGCGIAKCAEVATILSREFGVQFDSCRLTPYLRNGCTYTSMEILVGPLETSVLRPYKPEVNKFVDFSVYHLLFSAYLHSLGEFTVEVLDRYKPAPNPGKQIAALTVRKEQFGYELLTQSKVEKVKRNKVLADAALALSRSGIILSPNWDSVSTTLCRDDDVILGLDTNVLRGCFVSQQLLDGFMFHSPHAHVHTPNWLLLIIPNGVIHEIEQMANSREHGRLTEHGRLGYRALAEILELDQCKDLSGLSLMVVGEANPVLDTRVELRGLREDMGGRSDSGVKVIVKKLSAGDTHIRDQFKQFLRQISFHKGAYFLTADKSNAALARAEGLRSLYYATVRTEILQEPSATISMPGLVDDEPNYAEGGKLAELVLTVPLGKILFELAVQFGRIWIAARGKTKIILECDLTGDSVMHWVHKRLKVQNWKPLLEVYASSAGRVSIADAEDIWSKLNKQLMEDET
jgi:hypothetical protein